MTRFMIGQYGNFDYSKYNRDFKDGFYGIEACLFAEEADTVNLISESNKKDFRIGVHFPFRSGVTELRDALFLSTDPLVREQAYESVQAELEYLTCVKPEYVLFHYPKPVILDDRANWEKWKFGNEAEYIYESQTSLEELIEKSEYLFQWLTRKSVEFNFIPVLEFDALNKFIYEDDFLVELLNQFPTIKLCLDTARLHLQDKIDPNFCAIAVLRKYAKYAELVHLSNVQVNETVQNRHYPVLPELNPDEGWAPIEQYMQIIIKENRDVRIMFEHRSDLITDEQLVCCYDWVRALIEGES